MEAIIIVAVVLVLAVAYLFRPKSQPDIGNPPAYSKGAHGKSSRR